MKTYKALVVREYNNKYKTKIELQNFTKLLPDEVLIKVSYSSLNYKDCLSLTGHKGITRKYPHIAGIDASGNIVETRAKKFKVGDEVIVTGYDLGMNIAGGFSEYIKVPANWVIFKPENLTLKQAMMFGTAGFTAMSCYLNLKQHFRNLQNKHILINGVSGGVGLIASLILANKGTNLTLATRSTTNHPLNNIAANIIDSSVFTKIAKKPLLTRIYDGAIDNLGGIALDNLIKQIEYHGIICSCGNILGQELNTNIYPFILRGITLKGVSSANTIAKIREKIWLEISKFTLWPELENFITEISLNEIEEKSNLILSAKHQGRYLIKI